MSLTRDDWMKAIAETMPPPPVEDAITAREFADLAKCGWTTARLRLLAMCKAGKARQVRKRIIYGDGRAVCVNAFQLIKDKSR